MAISDSQAHDEEDSDILKIFQRHFESRFAPLPAGASQLRGSVAVDDASDRQDEESDEESEWNGCSSDEENGVQVVTHSVTAPAPVDPRETRAFMQSKPPSLPKRSAQATDQTTDTEDQEERLNLKNDLALQRLISESHLLDANRRGPQPGHRQKITEMRLKSLGSKKSVLEQEKMPLAHRKGIALKAREREDKRRHEARENGIILERPTKAKGVARGKTQRDRGVGGPGVGKFQNGTLKLGKRDVRTISRSGTRP